MDRPDHHQHQFFMPPPVQPQQHHHQLCVPTMMDDEQSFLVGTGGGGGGRGAAGRGERKRRFTEEQIRSLESTFHERHAKLEPREKAELARELGLQPRQVAIWFQNKRARWRSKQLEHDFADLRSKYDALHACVESLRQEKLALTAQLDKLSERLRERDQDRGGSAIGAGVTATATASSSSCNAGSEEADYVDDKRNMLGCVDMEPPESCVLGGACATPADVLSVESECGDHHHHLDYDDGFPESFCATPELWEPWPLVEWNAVA